MLRRLLLALVTALIVARPLVLGEDPGLLDRLTNAWGLLLSMLWFGAAVGWAIWRAWSGQTSWRGSGVEAGLLGVAALLWLSAAAAAHYKHPALLIASEWLVLLMAFCLVRQLARTPEDNHGLLAAILASGVSLSVFAVYQYTVEFPAIRSAYGSDREALLDAMAANNVVANPEALQRRLFEDNVFATYSHPNAFAGYLALLLPAAIGWMFRARGESRGFVFLCSAICLAFIGLALWLTHSRGAILGSLVVGVAVLAIYGRQFIGRHKRVFAIGLAVVGMGIFFLFDTGWAARGMAKFWQSSAKRTDYWIATWHMIRDHLWLGVGPGNFGRLYPRYMLPQAFEKIKDPHNFLLEIWATGGVFALLVLVISLGIFFRRLWPVLRVPSVNEPTPNKNAIGWNRWEFLVGGMVGLVLGFVLRCVDQSGDEILLEGALSAGRAFIWFVAFAVFYAIPWSGPSRPLALTAGVTALLLNLLFSGGIAMPSVAQPLWIMAALAMNGISPDPVNARPGAPWLPRMLPLPVLGGIGLAYFLLLFSPAVRCGDALSQARHYYVHWHTKVLPMLNPKEDEPAPPAQARMRLLTAASQNLQLSILDPLKQATQADPGNALAWLELAEWYGELWKVRPDPLVIDQAIHSAEQAQLLDPDNKDPYLFKHTLRLRIAQRFPQSVKVQYGDAAAAMRAAVERDPTNCRLHYQLADTLFLADLPVDGRRHARMAQELDEQSTQPERQLTDTQREQVQKWLTAKEQRE